MGKALCGAGATGGLCNRIRESTADKPRAVTVVVRGGYKGIQAAAGYGATLGRAYLYDTARRRKHLRQVGYRVEG